MAQSRDRFLDDLAIMRIQSALDEIARFLGRKAHRGGYGFSPSGLPKVREIQMLDQRRPDESGNALRFNANTLKIKSATKDLGLNSTQ